jgi:hypothetical protein
VRHMGIKEKSGRDNFIIFMRRHREREGGLRLDKCVIVKMITTHGRRGTEVDVDLSRNLGADSPPLNEVGVEELVKELRGMGKNPLGHQRKPYKKPWDR